MAISSDKYSKSHDTLDWDALRLQSLAPGGFRSARTLLWPSLLHVDVNPTQPSLSTEDQTEPDPHRDERQIRLDTDRSFVLYPVDDGPEDVRLARQAELNHLIVQTFRRHPGLNYFQGFHDIATVLQLTLPPKIALPALEKISLHRLRDSMGRTLEPLTSLMLILQRLLRLVDLPYAMLLEDVLTREGQHIGMHPSPMQLPHLLTLFAHATPSLPLIQHIFDYLLVRPPLAIVYLVAAVTLLRKDLVLKLGEGGDGDEGMIHSVLTGLPEFTDYGEDQDNGEGYEVQLSPELPPAATKRPNHIPLPMGASDALSMCKGSENVCNTAPEAELRIGAPPAYPSPGSLSRPYTVDGTATTQAETCALGTVAYPPSPRDEGTPSVPVVGDPSVLPTTDALASFDPADIPLPPSRASTRPASPECTGTESLLSRTVYSLPKVFLLADELFTRFPPSTPELRLSHTIGPASAMQTWAQDVTLMPSDDQAEALVVAGTDIIVREAPKPDSQNRKELQKRAKKRGMKKARKGEGRLLVAGAVLVLGVAVAYGWGISIGGEADWRALLGTLGAIGESVLECLAMHSSDCSLRSRKRRAKLIAREGLHRPRADWLMSGAVVGRTDWPNLRSSK
ncbi:rab-GTPase-TBC domain-containing protein [Multifurca ochricompacta]|uniref:Rab-GTPase-TBC domain-containing protein n=1 Tax=Multifurca ochricompacta TaxID=376703 RepID=A0AAD4M1P9_9AGAM|nr:rab-GTPase-TBC domain-containing protein [Multifurca ochricompacta]